MTWFKVDDSFYDHPKVFDAPDCALALWVRAGCWSARNLTDGFVPASLPARLCDDPDTAVRELVERGLWYRTKGGYQFHDWTEYQPSAADVKDLRTKRAEAGRRGGQAKAAKQTASKPLASASDVAKQNAAPSRPVPSRRDESSLSPPLQVADARAKPGDEDEDLDKANEHIEARIIELLAEHAGRPVDRAWAAKVRRQLLDDRQVDNPLGYVAACIRGEPARYLPSAAPVEAGNQAIAHINAVDREVTGAATERRAPEVRAAMAAAKARKAGAP